MTEDDDVIMVSRKVLREVFMEFERQQTREYFYLCDCLKQMEQAYISLHRLVEGCYSTPAKVAITKLLFPLRGDFTITDELFHQWRAECRAQREQEKADDEREGATLLIHKQTPSRTAK